MVSILNNSIEPEISIKNYNQQILKAIEGSGHCRYGDNQDGSVNEALSYYGIKSDEYELNEVEKYELRNVSIFLYYFLNSRLICV